MAVLGSSWRSAKSSYDVMILWLPQAQAVQGLGPVSPSRQLELDGSWDTNVGARRLLGHEFHEFHEGHEEDMRSIALTNHSKTPWAMARGMSSVGFVTFVKFVSKEFQPSISKEFQPPISKESQPSTVLDPCRSSIHKPFVCNWLEPSSAPLDRRAPAR